MGHYQPFHAFLYDRCLSHWNRSRYFYWGLEWWKFLEADRDGSVLKSEVEKVVDEDWPVEWHDSRSFSGTPSIFWEFTLWKVHLTSAPISACRHSLWYSGPAIVTWHPLHWIKTLICSGILSWLHQQHHIDHFWHSTAIQCHFLESLGSGS